jgi:hypothetical protein
MLAVHNGYKTNNFAYKLQTEKNRAKTTQTNAILKATWKIKKIEIRQKAQ